MRVCCPVVCVMCVELSQNVFSVFLHEIRISYLSPLQQFKRPQHVCYTTNHEPWGRVNHEQNSKIVRSRFQSATVYSSMSHMLPVAHNRSIKLKQLTSRETRFTPKSFANARMVLHISMA